MKKIIARIILVCIVMVLILTYCTNQDNNTQKDKEQNKEQIEKIEDDMSDDVNDNELEAEDDKSEDSNKDQTTQEVKPNIPPNTTNEDSSKQDDQNNTETVDENGNVVKTFKITAYCPCAKCCGKSDGITASGTKATAGRTVGCNSLPFGTQVEIFGHVYAVEDVGGMKNDVIDIFFNSHQEALNFGVKYTEVIIYQ